MAQDPKPSEITPEALYLKRRELIRNAALFVGTSAAIGSGLVLLTSPKRRPAPAVAGPAVGPLEVAKSGEFKVDEAVTEERDATTYNNFYELGTSKSDPSANAGSLKVRPWTVE